MGARVIRGDFETLIGEALIVFIIFLFVRGANALSDYGKEKDSK